MLSRSPLYGTKTRVTFRVPLDEPPGLVSVVGDFNGWEPGRHVLDPRRNGTRSVTVTLPPGEHRFRYLASDGVWFDDETADRIDEHGCLIKV